MYFYNNIHIFFKLGNCFYITKIYNLVLNLFREFGTGGTATALYITITYLRIKIYLLESNEYDAMMNDN